MTCSIQVPSILLCDSYTRECVRGLQVKVISRSGIQNQDKVVFTLNMLFTLNILFYRIQDIE